MNYSITITHIVALVIKNSFVTLQKLFIRHSKYFVLANFCFLQTHTHHTQNVILMIFNW